MKTGVDTSREAVLRHICEMLEVLIQDPGGPPVTSATRLSDAGLDSICSAYLIGELQQFYGLGDILYRKLFVADNPVQHIQVCDLVELISTQEMSRKGAA